VNAGFLILAIAYIAVIVVCFAKGKQAFALVGLLGLYLPLAGIVAWFPIVGALRYAKPNSGWARSRYGPAEIVIATSRFDDKDEQKDLGPHTEGGLPPRPPGYSSAFSSDPQSIVQSPSERSAISAFLRKAREEGAIDPPTFEGLLAFLDRLPAATVAPPIEHERPAAQSTPPLDAPIPSGAPPLEPPLPPPPPAARSGPQSPTRSEPRAATTPTKAPGPSPVSLAASRIWDAVASDVALHGFAYLGVALTFVGVVGFLLFAFADVANSAQPFVELFIALIFFGWAWVLHRQQAHRVAEGMSWIGKMLLPLIVFAGLVDNAPFPPDFNGKSLIAALTITALAMAAAYGWFAVRNPASTLRFLVAPLLWLAGLTLGFVFKSDEALVGDAITRLVSAQFASASVILALTLRAAIWRPGHRFADPTMKAALVGLPVVYLSTVSLAAAEGWAHLAPLVVLGIATATSVEFIARWFHQRRHLPVIRPIVIAGIVVPLVPAWGPGWAGLVMAAAYLGLLELTARTGRENQPALFLAGAGVVVGAGLSFAEPSAVLVVFVGLTLWAHLRRRNPETLADAADLLDISVAALPLGVGYGLVEVFDNSVAWLIMASVLAAVTLVARATRAGDFYWTYWPTAAALLVALGAFDTWSDGGRTETLTVATVALTAGVVGLGQRWTALRLWMGLGLLSGALAIGLDTWDYPGNYRPAVWAASGLALVVFASVWKRSPNDHLAAIGHVMSTAAIIAYPGGTAGAIVVGTWSLAWIAAVVTIETSDNSLNSLIERALRYPVDKGIERLAAASRWLVPVVMAAGLSPAILTVAAEWDQFAATRSWTGVALAAIALTLAFGARLTRGRRPLGRVLAIAAVTNSVIGLAVSAPATWPMIVAAAAVIMVAIALSGDLRAPGFVWFAWITSVVLVWLLGDAAGVPSDGLYVVTLGWGVTMLLGGLAMDDSLAGRREVGDGLRVQWLRYPVLVGAAVLPLSLGPISMSGTVVFGWSAIGASAAYLLVAHLLRLGLAAAPAYALLAVGVGAVSPWDLLDEPWRLIVLAAPMVALSWVLARAHISGVTPDLWHRWDLSPLVVAHLVGGFALVFSLGSDTFAATALTFAALSIVVGLWKRHRAWIDVGNLLIIGAGADSGPGWLSLSLGATSIRGAIGVDLSTGIARVANRWISVVSAGGAWVALAVWKDWSEIDLVAYSAVTFGSLAVLVAVAARFGSLRSDSIRVWGSFVTIGIAAAGIGAINPDGDPWIDGPWLAVGLGLLALAFTLAGTKPGPDMRLWAPVPAGLAWIAVAFAYDWNHPQFVTATALTYGALALTSGLLARTRRAPLALVLRWGGLGTAGVALAGLLSIDLSGELWWGPSVAIGLVAVATAFQLAVPVIDPTLRYLAVLTTGLAWAALAHGMAWDREIFVVLTTVVFGALTIGMVEMSRLGLLSPSRDNGEGSWRYVVRSWVILGAGGVLSAAALGVESRDDALAAWATVGMAALALSSGRGARPLRLEWLREASGVIALGAATLLGVTADVGDSRLSVGVVGISVAATSAALMIWAGRPGSVWLRPMFVLGLAANLEAGVFALIALPSRALLVAVLLSVGVQALAAGITLNQLRLLAGGPPALGAAFLLMIADNLGGSPQWYAIPIGLALIVELEIMRQIDRAAGRERTGDELMVLEWLGIGLLAAPPLAEMFATGIVYGLAAYATAMLLLMWAVATKVRRRAIAAGSLAVAASVLSLFAAAAGGAPDSAVFWIVAIGVGFAVMLVAALIEAYRSKKGRVMARFDELMEGWE
jgi:hypothetical protein